jgi:tRNA pseudouridine55 synthase
MNRPKSECGRLNNRVFPVNKSRGISTYDCIRRFKRVVHCDKIGHAGSLDPEARGLILILTGEATKLSNYLMDLPKRYAAEIKLGETTDTQDDSGTVLRTGPWEHVTEEAVRSALPRFLGKRLQTPPMYSALKHRGTPLYLLARRGESVDRNPREVETYEIVLRECRFPVVSIEVYCSRGLYLRVLAEEIGQALGVPAHLGALMRTRIGHFDLDAAVADDAFALLLEGERRGFSLSEAVRHFPAVKLSEEQSRGLEKGVAPRVHAGTGSGLPPPGSLVRLERSDGALGAIAQIGVAGFVQLRRVFREGAR